MFTNVKVEKVFTFSLAKTDCRIIGKKNPNGIM